jgi:SAM-dependent methyltransferase
MDLTAYRQSERERQRLNDLLRLLPNRGHSILEVGPRDGHHSALLKERFDSVVGVDLAPPRLSLFGVSMAQASVTALPFRSSAFACVLCAEVLEHVPDVEQAAAEISRVASGAVIIGVPFRQDTRAGQLTCRQCGKVNPPYGHVNTFDEQKLRTLFHTLEPVEFSLIGSTTARTNSLASWLMTKGGNPWAAYDQDEPCIFCGNRFELPPPRKTMERVCSALAHRLNMVQRLFTRPAAAWIHALFRKPGSR